VLEVKNLACDYGKVNAVRGVNLSVSEGELVALVGANGAGKSTTLRALSGLISPTRGSVSYRGEDITNCSARQIVKRGIAHCPEGRHVFPQMTVGENIELGCYLRTDRSEVARDTQKMFDRFPILGRRRTQPAGLLSGGEQQMLAIARALMSRPQLIMFDEPSLGLAPSIIDEVFNLIAEICKTGTTVLLVEQNAYAALEMCDRAYLLESGEVRRTGTGQELLRDPQVQAVYLGGKPSN
jgi:branched-chain amino acid transport system ATP-binding protein